MKQAGWMGTLARVLALFVLLSAAGRIAPAEEEAATRQQGRVFDLAVSLSYEPGASYPETEAERRRYERVIEYFADAVYEMSEGAHQLGKITFYVKGQESSEADIVWGREGWPRTNESAVEIQGGFGLAVPRGHMYLYDELAFEEPLDTLENPKAGGYTLGRLWAHYAYGLEEEYLPGRLVGMDAGDPNPIDSPPAKTLLKDHWRAAETDDTGWLNLSTAPSYQRGKLTAQYRRYRASAWDTLARDPRNDPKELYLKNRKYRPYYPELTRRTETRVNLPGAARAELELIWRVQTAGDPILFLVLDKSGSMTGEKIESTKQAAISLVEFVETGTLSIGVIAFNDVADLVVPPAFLATEGDKQEVIAAISEIEAGGFTRIDRASDLALEVLLDAGAGEGGNQAVFLLTDGISDAGLAQESALRYTPWGIPIYTFAVGSGAAIELLDFMAAETGGIPYILNSPAEIQEAFLEAFFAASLTGAPVSLAEASGTADPGFTEVVSFPVDSTLDILSVEVSYGGPVESARAELVSPLGITYPSDRCSTYTQACRWKVEGLEPGIWEMRYTPNSQRQDYGVSVTGFATEQSTYSVELMTASGQQSFEGPEPAVLIARVERDVPITGVEMTGRAQGPDGGSFPLNFNDEGEGWDAEAGDGRYTAELPHDTAGDYIVSVSVRNSAGEARQSASSVLSIPGPGKVLPGAGVETAYEEDFLRLDNLKLTATSSIPLDLDFFPGRELPPANLEIPELLNSAVDVDYFLIPPTGIVKWQAVRVHALAKELDLQARLLKRDETEIDVLTEEDARNLGEPGYIHFLLPPSPEERILEVESLSGRRGGYHASFGDPLPEEIGSDLVYIDFEDGDGNWWFLAPESFHPSTGEYDEGGLHIDTTDNTLTFSFWESPLISPVPREQPAGISMDGDSGLAHLYRTRFHVFSGVEDRALAPTVRSRTSARSFQQADVFVATSTGNGELSPDPDGQVYSHFFTVPENEPVFRLDFDVLNFMPDNAAVDSLRLETAAVESLGFFPISVPREDAFLDFSGGNTHGWTPRTAEPLGAPTLIAEMDGLEIIADPERANEVIFGFWGSPEENPAVVLEKGRLYRTSFFVSSRAIETNRVDLPAFRLRVNDASLRTSTYVNVESIGEESRLPRQTVQQRYDTYLYVPEESDGEPLLFSFDFLNVPQMFNNPGLGVVLNSVRVESFDYPLDE